MTTLINNRSVPRTSPSTIATETDGETVLYSNGSEQALLINQSSALIWQLCDGKSSVDDIIKLLQDAFPEQDIQDDVFSALNSFLNAGVITLA